MCIETLRASLAKKAFLGKGEERPEAVCNFSELITPRAFKDIFLSLNRCVLLALWPPPNTLQTPKSKSQR
jgi:hypothetical protein